MKLKHMWICLVILVLMPFQVYAGGPMETAETEVNKILAVLADESLTGEAGTKAKKEKLRSIFDNIFDKFLHLKPSCLVANIIFRNHYVVFIYPESMKIIL